MRDAALQTLDGIEAALRHTSTAALTLPEAVDAVQRRIEALRAAAKLFLSAKRDPTGDATRFAEPCSQEDPERVVETLVRRDGRGVCLDAQRIIPGSAFDHHGGSQPGRENEEDIEPEEHPLPLPAGISGRVRALRSLHDDMESVSPTTPGSIPA